MGLMDIRYTLVSDLPEVPTQTLQYQTLGAAGADLCAAERGAIPAGDYRVFRTGVCIELPQHIEGQVRPRSGLAAKHGVTVLNAPGTIDSDYRGEIMVVLVNHGKETHVVEAGDRIAQLVLSPVVHGSFHPADQLAKSERGANRFGSTGV